MTELNDKNLIYCEKHGVFPFCAKNEKTFIYYSLYQLEKTVYKITVTDGAEVKRRSCPGLLKNKRVYSNAFENMSL